MQMAAGAQFENPELYFTGVVNAVHGQLQGRIGAAQAQRFADALRLQWAGLRHETKGQILQRWGDWTNDPEALATGVVDLSRGKLERYVGSTTLDASSRLDAAATTVNDQAADAARQALADYFAKNPD
jgi:uncharacterized protein YjbJ (UPF0337 family)